MKIKNRPSRPWRKSISCLFLITGFVLSGCGTSVNYSFTGTSTTAETISITEFYNNADLGPANMGQTFTNQIKNYFIQNSSLSVVAEEGELQLEGEIVDLRVTPIAPVSTGDPNALTTASSTRITITVKATYINTLDETMSFKDKTFSFYRDLPNEVNLADLEEQYIRDIFERIINDIFNASVANW
ncbi:MAG TPA: LPS assembly lipoprotein LptE [Ohtaekwangia sp.]|nr:LPS assembly lipoprotein LptE [Ohtaekwangia sp.]